MHLYALASAPVSAGFPQPAASRNDTIREGGCQEFGGNYAGM